MNASAKLTALVLAASVACAGVASAFQGRGGDVPVREPAAETKPAAEPRFAELPDEAGWRELVARDGRLAFTARSSSEARAVLDIPDASAERRAIAMVALGASGTLVERTRLQRIAREGSDLERRAAILSLGEMSAPVGAEFEEWFQKADAQHAECALLAMLRCDRRADRRRVEEIAADPAHAHAATAADLLVFVVNPGASKPTRAAALLLRLRFEAARRHGLVDGENWRLATIRGLAANRDFARDVVLFATSDLKSPAVRDHAFATLSTAPGRARLHAAIAAIPRELGELVENNLWKPRDANDWRDLLEEIERARVERLALPIVRAALDVTEVRYRAVALASLAGDEDLSPLIGIDAAKLSTEERISVCLAIGARTDPSWLERLAVIGEDKDPRVRAAFLVARYRQGQQAAVDAVNATLADEKAPGHDEIVEALCAAAHDPAVQIALEGRFVEAVDREKTLLATTLCLEGRPVGRAHVRAALAAEPPPEGAEAVRLVRALRHDATSEDIGVLRTLFPSIAGDIEFDRELALALLEHSDPDVFPIVRAALWDKDFDVSILAGGVLAHMMGIRALVEELRSPPRSASSGDLRRVGFAVGEWGGVEYMSTVARELRWATGDPALQGALLGALSTRTQ
jgi:hypothetical protein